MKKYSIVLTCLLAMLYFILSSDVDGAAHHGHGDVTGAPSGTTGHCQTSSCHGANNAGTIVQLQVLDTTAMLPITQYHAGQTYLVTLTGDATAITTNLPGFGFMVSAVSGSHTLSGTYTIPSTLTSNIHTYPCGATTVVEHSSTMRQTTTGTNKYETQFYWTAPSTFSDSVSFYSLLNAVNGNGASSGDYPNAAPKVTIYEYVTDKVNALNYIANKVTLYPNPAGKELTINANEKINSINIINSTGNVIYTHQCNAQQVTINIGDLPNGIYCVKINDSEVSKFLKK